MGNPIVNCMHFHGSRHFMKIEKSQKKTSENRRTNPLYFSYHLKRLKNVHSFLQLEVLEIKISHRFRLAPGNSYSSGWGCSSSTSVVFLRTQLFNRMKKMKRIVFLQMKKSIIHKNLKIVHSLCLQNFLATIIIWKITTHFPSQQELIIFLKI